MDTRARGGGAGLNVDTACRTGLNDDGAGLLVLASRGISWSDDRVAEAEKIWDIIDEAREDVIKFKISPFALLG